MEITADMMAPCGMDCALCLGYQREKNPCAGCRGSDDHKPQHCVKCAIKNCVEQAFGAGGFCYQCGKFPCARLKRLDTRYRFKYGMSMTDNLVSLRERGMAAFLASENSKWACSACGQLLMVHGERCPHCGTANPWFPKRTSE